MKIIGKTKDGFILQASETETYNLVGYYSRSDAGGRRPYLETGDEIQINEMYHKLYDLKQHQNTLNQTATTLECVARLLREQNPVVRNCSEKKEQT